jgi:hypothetical protein
MLKKILLFQAIFLIFSCKEIKQNTPVETKPFYSENVPIFNADSAFLYVKNQVDFGPRVPGTKAWSNCASWYLELLKPYNLTISEQKTKVKNHSNKELPVHNIMVQYNASAKKRILIASHWDSRAIADQDTERKAEAVLGADDGASGVGVMLEIIRVINLKKDLKIGVDFLFIDTEDVGPADYEALDLSDVERMNSWCLGSQYWAKNKVPAGYNANFGVLLDMVGGKGNTFTMEGTSMMFAGSAMKKVWDTGNRIGYSAFFLYEKTSPVTDDHLFINQLAGLPMIDIINHQINQEPSFGKCWHTHCDDMNRIDKSTLKAVGQTLLQVLYDEAL